MKRIFFLPILFSLFLFTLLFPRSVFAAKFILDPLSKSLKVGEEFQVKINLDTQSKEVNGIQAKLIFSKDLLEVKGVSFSGIFPANFQSVDNANGNVWVSSGEDLSTDSFNGTSTWVTLTLKGKSKGSAELRFSCPDSVILDFITKSDNLLDCSSLGAGSYTITEESQPQPTATHTPEPGGNGGQPGPSCTDSSPNTPTNLGAASGPNNGEVTLTWTKVSADYYSVFFGGASRAYQYGAVNIGNTNQYIVRSLTPGKLYYFAVTAVRGCASSGFSNEASARGKGATGGTPAKVTPKASPKPTPTPAYKPIGEILPEVDFPTEEEVVTPTPMPTGPAEKRPWPIRTILIVGFFLMVLITLIISIWRTIKEKLPPPPPNIVIPSEPSPPTQEQA